MINYTFAYDEMSLPNNATTKQFITDIDFMVRSDAFSYIGWSLDPKGGEFRRKTSVDILDDGLTYIGSAKHDVHIWCDIFTR